VAVDRALKGVRCGHACLHISICLIVEARMELVTSVQVNDVFRYRFIIDSASKTNSTRTGRIYIENWSELKKKKKKKKKNSPERLKIR
jgi:hypothetical protein